MVRHLPILLSLLFLTACGSDSNDAPTPPPPPPAPPTFEATLSYEVALNGSQQVPNNSTDSTASAEVLVDENLMLLSASLNVDSVAGVQAAHIHTGNIGINGGVLIEFTEAGDGSLVIDETDVTEDFIEAIRSKQLYINVHTESFPDGEVRGQILPETASVLTFSLSGQQEVPAVATAASGFAYATYDSADGALQLTARTSGVDDATAAHIHTGRIGENGDVLVGLEASMDEMGVWTAPADLSIDSDTFDTLASGGHYVNVHTPSNPSGEIRGQILTANYALAAFNLSGQQEVPAVTTSASGSGYALIDTTDYSVELKVLTTGVDDATAAHIHTGRIGENGGVLVALEPSMDQTGVWMAPADLAIDAEIYATLASGGHYVNVHTPEFTSGEIRGQILTANYALATFNLSGQQEVPAVTTSASGSGYALIDSIDYSVELKVLTTGVDDATAAHIHTGRIGENGDVLVGLESSMDEAGVWMAPADLAIDAEIFATLASGGHYVNVHTPSNPSGEIRGQILTANYALAAFSLSGQQEVPAVTTSASGSGYALIDTIDYSVELKVLTTGVDDATAAHIHTGRIGENGDVLVGLESSMDEAGVWMAPADLAIDAEIFATLASGGHYVNVHTPSNPSGEIRGQILTSNFALAAFDLSGEQEVPALSKAGNGSGYALIDITDYSLELKVLTEGVDDATAAHIHTGRIGENGGVLVALEPSMDETGVWKAPAELAIDADIFATLASGGHYVNVHTPSNASGEIRGQILTANYALAAFNLSGQQEVPAVTTSASGSGYALIDLTDYSVELKVLTEGVDNATAAHIHTGRIGNNGDVLVGLESSMDEIGVWMAPADLAIDADVFATLASGGHYVNVHTPSNPSGEIRGQILTSNFALAAFDLSGQQEVPAVTTSASGSGYALIDITDYSLELKVLTEGVDDATAAHIHTGRIGENGGVLVALEPSMDEFGVWTAPVDLAIDADIFATLASGGHYVNVHTPSNPSGEIRGQILTEDYNFIAFALDGSQEVPPNSSIADGDGYALSNSALLSLEVVAVTRGVSDATMAHIHTGVAGENGPVLVALLQSSDDVNVWSTPVNVTVDLSTYQVFLNGGHYVNVHTPAFPSGEIRGQIE